MGFVSWFAPFSYQTSQTPLCYNPFYEESFAPIVPWRGWPGPGSTFAISNGKIYLAGKVAGDLGELANTTGDVVTGKGHQKCSGTYVQPKVSGAICRGRGRLLLKVGPPPPGGVPRSQVGPPRGGGTPPPVTFRPAEGT